MSAYNTLNADGSVSSIEYAMDGVSVFSNKAPAADVQTLEYFFATEVINNTNFPYSSAASVADLVFAVRDGLVTEAQVLAWSASNNIQVSYPGSTVVGATPAKLTESMLTALNDPQFTSNGGLPTLSQAAADAAANPEATATTAAAIESANSAGYALDFTIGTLLPGGQVVVAGPTAQINGVGSVAQLAELGAQAELSAMTSALPASGPASISGVSSATEAIQAAYIAFYGRPADSGGLAYWAGELQAAGGNLDAVVSAFGNSTESQALYGGQSVEQMLTAIYQQEFNRAPDAAGEAYWASQIRNGAISAAGAALAILNGATGSDQAVINDKLVVATAFTSALTQESFAAGLYGGDTAAANARLYLSSVDGNTAHAVLMAGIAQQVAQGIQTEATVANAITGVGITLMGQPTQTVVETHTVAA
ncbi:uncharacterized protein DUF4214 [Paraburkholderia unamae]|uniref:DUF4214 domain-containing protein n=1 Tax=Paraburkholderia unamae TaxID=219649 RepID=UPI000DC55C84|nr:DUF4214 domain-containing protein [Paraburkholderia unamae]RAR56146.1 uncharacterized protein DUF4214 [Paraburkholderia unamae]